MPAARLEASWSPHCCQATSGKKGAPSTSSVASWIAPAGRVGALPVVKEMVLRAVSPWIVDATIVTSYEVSEPSPASSTTWRVAGARSVVQSTGTAPAGPHCSRAVDGSDVVQTTVAAYDAGRADVLTIENRLGAVVAATVFDAAMGAE